jgi:hypothetical protein
MRRAATVLACVLALALAATGCGLGAGKTPGGVRLTVTHDFGTGRILDTPSPQRAGSETVMRLLQRNARVKTRYGGNFVQGIDGRAGGRSGGRRVDWFFYVNGIESSRGASDVKVHDGDRIWWDRHDWGTTLHVPAVIGSFPEPFLHGVDGKRLPSRVECATARSPACRAVTDGLRRVGVVAGIAAPGVATGPDTLRIDPAAGRLERGPKLSGVYLRPSADGRMFSALDARGRVARRLGAGTGLVAATAVEGEQPTWIVTGTDEAGVSSAAQAFAAGESALSDKFALAVSADRPIALPVSGGSSP